MVPSKIFFFVPSSLIFFFFAPGAPYPVGLGQDVLSIDTLSNNKTPKRVSRKRKAMVIDSMPVGASKLKTPGLNSDFPHDIIDLTCDECRKSNQKGESAAYATKSAQTGDVTSWIMDWRTN